MLGSIFSKNEVPLPAKAAPVPPKGQILGELVATNSYVRQNLQVALFCFKNVYHALAIIFNMQIISVITLII